MNFTTGLIINRYSKYGEKSEIVGILQLVLKQKNAVSRDEKTVLSDQVLNMIGIDEPLESSVTKYSEFIATAIHLLKSREKSTKISAISIIQNDES